MLTTFWNESDKSGRFLGGQRRRANSTTGENPRQPSPRPSTARSGHSRASSEFAGTFLRDYSPTQPSSQRQRPSIGPTGSFNSSLHVGSPTSPLVTPLLDLVSPYGSDLRRGHRADSFLDMDDDSIRDPDDVPILEREGSVLEDDGDGQSSRTNGFTWDELIDRLLGETMSRSDKDFIAIFLCFYRKIAPPSQLLDSILSRFEKVGDTERLVLQRIEAQTRYCQVLLQWITHHPGDFAYPTTRHKLQNFVNGISGNRSFALLAREMSQAMLRICEDEDACWGRTDNEAERSSSVSSFLTGSSTSGDTSTLSSAGEEFAKSFSDNTLHVPPFDDRRPSEAPSHMSMSSVTSSLQLSTRDQYALFMQMKDEDIATELTRIDWSEFSRIRPRDLVRHVSIAPDLKEKCESLQHVNRMISHFNHVAYWVANIILERPKAKHRARALEKFMNVAWLLRHRNNYNALGAVIAGINGTAVHRLSLTRDLVNQETHRRFMRLELLMSTHKSHFAYRLAWENTSQQRIPFLPLHRRDLVSADEGNRTFVQDGDRINWNKFQVMGEVLTVITKAQTTPYPDLQRNPNVERLILDAVLNTNDDDLYERSVQLESSNGGQQDSTKRKRIWFQR
ncbi:ras GEF [Ascobolus immersus RN42]|uniref:Ras GEF n=1 Tax=Ascobolus immersus RN42 TaxID=1160509 RepID=A0A3N4ILC2_ASCIM|nr:ras GEF [Ascobolus immersus RN42]